MPQYSGVLGSDTASLLRQCEALEALTTASRPSRALSSSGRGSLARTESMMSQGALSSAAASTRAPDNGSWSSSSTGSIRPSFFGQLNEHSFPGKPAPSLTSQLGADSTSVPVLQDELDTCKGPAISTDSPTLGNNGPKDGKGAASRAARKTGTSGKARPRPASSKRSTAGGKASVPKPQHAEQTLTMQRSQSCTLPSTWMAGPMLEGPDLQDTLLLQQRSHSTDFTDQGLDKDGKAVTQSAEMTSASTAPRLVRNGRRRSSAQRAVHGEQAGQT